MPSRQNKQNPPPLRRGFRGGLYMGGEKDPAYEKEAERLRAVPCVLLPLGGALAPCVEAGERVLEGQLIASADGERLYSTAAGIVELIDGEDGAFIRVNCDFTEERCQSERPMDRSLMSPEDILELIRRADVRDGDKPLAELLEFSRGAETLVVRALDTEPLVSSCRRAALEFCEDMIDGVRLILSVLSRARCLIAVDEGDEALLRALKNALISDRRCRVYPLRAKYPRDNAELLASCFSGYKPGSPAALRSCAVIGSYTAAAAGQAAESGRADLFRLVTVAGDAIANPKNLLVPIGTPFSALAAACGGYLRTPHRLIDGGLLRGTALRSDAGCVGRTTSAFLAITGEPGGTARDCIGCGRCAEVCPSGLMPSYIYRFCLSDAPQRALRLRPDQCIGCGLCSYVCPSCLPLAGALTGLRSSTDLHAKDDLLG